MKKRIALFCEWFKIALFTIGGGYAIIVVADEVFGRKLKWLEEGELVRHLPIISSIPGIIAGNTAIYCGLKIAGRAGAIIALLGTSLPSFAIFLVVSVWFGTIPRDNIWINGVFLGLRSSLTGVVLGTLWKTLFKTRADWSKGIGINLPPLSKTQQWIAALGFTAALAIAAIFAFDTLRIFLGFGFVSIGGGFPLVPFYCHQFVGESAPFLQMTTEDFSNLMAMTQMTPGPVSVNAATYFGFRMHGVFGSLVATAALLLPSYFLMTFALTGLSRWKDNVVVNGIIFMLKPISITLMTMSAYRFAISGISYPLAIVATIAFASGKIGVMKLIFGCALIGLALAALELLTGVRL